VDAVVNSASRFEYDSPATFDSRLLESLVRSNTAAPVALAQALAAQAAAQPAHARVTPCVVNLLDTPGHKDFSEDTYRVLTAVDAAVMVIDAGKGIESQTRKLFEVCRKRGVPIFTFMNKLDRPARPPLELLDELESVLGIHALPMNWPLGDGPEFRGVFDRKEKSVHLFEKTPAGAYRAPVSVAGIQDETVRAALAPDVHAKVCDELDLLDGAGSGLTGDRGDLCDDAFDVARLHGQDHERRVLHRLCDGHRAHRVGAREVLGAVGRLLGDHDHFRRRGGLSFRSGVRSGSEDAREQRLAHVAAADDRDPGHG
jgi:small GTP-binding protein